MKYLIIIFLLFETFYCISLKTDPIHRQDEPRAISWANKQRLVHRDRIYIVSDYSMMPNNNKKGEARYTTQMLRIGYHKREIVKFGGVNGHTVVYIYEKNN